MVKGKALVFLLLLTSCATSHCPDFPDPKPCIAEELESFEGECTWEWLGRLEKFERQLEN